MKFHSGLGGISSLPTQPRHPCIDVSTNGGYRCVEAAKGRLPYGRVLRLDRQGGHPTMFHR